VVSHADDRLKAALAAIANAGLDALPAAQLGAVELRDDQRRIVARAQRALDQHGGCLIAEAVGRGKTYVALALARRWQRPLVVVPASLRTTWSAACRRAEVSCEIISHESLSRGALPCRLSSRAERGACALTSFDGIIVDESHHFRTPTTRRYAELATLAARAPLVMLSATPLQNRSRDLAAQIALYLGEMALTLDLSALSSFVIRGSDDDGIVGMPMVSAPEWVELDADDGLVLRGILALTAPAKPLDGGDAGALRTISLVRAWASSRAALEATLRSRRRLAAAVEQGVEAGRAPTRREVRAWHGVENVVQLGFASLLMDGTPSAAMLGELSAALERERDTLGELARVLRATPDPDVARVSALRRIRAEHPGSPIIAFSEFASTITSFYSALRADAGVGMLTAREARIASGRITRDELLARFAPVAQHAPPVAAHESVTLLLATDLLSEGVNLQDASVVVHLDLPWNPARLAQRVGRLRRPGGAREVRAYLLAPPARAGLLLDADARLRRKLATAERVIGRGIGVLPALARESASSLVSTTPQGDDASAMDEGAFTAQLELWRSGAVGIDEPSGCIVAGVESHIDAWLAALDDGRIISSIDGRISDSPSSALRVAKLAYKAGRLPHDDETRDKLSELHNWLAAEQLATACGLDAPSGPYRRTVLNWLETLTRKLPRHERASTLPLVGQLRAALRTALPLGAEHLLAAIATRRAVRAHQALQSALTIVEHRTHGRSAISPTGARVVALVLTNSDAAPGKSSREYSTLGDQA
jgi:superfamily II DNA or RNA helicase